MKYKEKDSNDKRDIMFKIGIVVAIIGVILIITGSFIRKSTPNVLDETPVNNSVADVSNNDNTSNSTSDNSETSNPVVDPETLSPDVSIEEVSLNTIDDDFRSVFFPLIVNVYNANNEAEAEPVINDIKSQFGDQIGETIMTSTFSQITKERVYEEVFQPSLLLKGPFEVSAPIDYLEYTLIVPARLIKKDDQDFGITQNVYFNFNYYPETRLINDISVRALDGEVFKDE